MKEKESERRYIMKIRDVMTSPAIRIHPEEPVSVAARTLEHYNIGARPVCGSDGRLQGLVTDRDIVTRCLATERNPGQTRVAQVMTGQILTVGPDASTAEAARLMGARQVRRLPVVENGKLIGMISLGDLAGSFESNRAAGDALTEISLNISTR